MIGSNPARSLTRKPAAMLDTRKIASELSAKVTKSVPASFRARAPSTSLSRLKLFGGSSSVTIKVGVRTTARRFTPGGAAPAGTASGARAGGNDGVGEELISAVGRTGRTGRLL